MRIHLFHPQRRERGNALTEMALTLPILLLVLMGIMDFGRVLFLYNQVSNAAREGARFGSVLGVYDPTIGEIPQFTNCPEIRAAVVRHLGLGPTIPDESITITYDDGQTALPQDCSGSMGPTLAQVETGDRIIVQVEAEFTFITPFVRLFIQDVPVTFTAARTILIGGVLVPPTRG